MNMNPHGCHIRDVATEATAPEPGATKAIDTPPSSAIR